MYILPNNVSKFPNLRKVEKLNSVNDVATLLDTFKRVREVVSYKDIADVLEDEEGFYFFLLGGEGDFSLYDFINNVFDEDIRVSCINANLVFPVRLSRGVKEALDTSDEIDEDDIPTGFLGGDDPDVDKVYFIVRKSDGSKTEIPQKGIVVGRSSKKSDYVVRGNDNIGRVHCQLYMEDGVLRVHDFKSKNGTFVNNVKVRYDYVILKDGDTLTLADEEFLIVEG